MLHVSRFVASALTIAVAAVSLPGLELLGTASLQDPVRKAPQGPAAATDPDRAAVVRAGLDYVEAIYDVKPELVERSVHKELSKFGFYRRGDAATYQGSAMTFAQLKKLAGSWNENGERANAESPKKVEVLDLMDQTAVLKVTAVWGVDHMQLGKFDGKWQIRHILWQSSPAK